MIRDDKGPRHRLGFEPMTRRFAVQRLTSEPREPAGLQGQKAGSYGITRDLDYYEYKRYEFDIY
jgi:hypothetical protein